jgi:hypothetical protein
MTDNEHRLSSLELYDIERIVFIPKSWLLIGEDASVHLVNDSQHVDGLVSLTGEPAKSVPETDAHDRLIMRVHLFIFAGFMNRKSKVADNCPVLKGNAPLSVSSRGFPHPIGRFNRPTGQALISTCHFPDHFRKARDLSGGDFANKPVLSVTSALTTLSSSPVVSPL